MDVQPSSTTTQSKSVDVINNSSNSKINKRTQEAPLVDLTNVTFRTNALIAQLTALKLLPSLAPIPRGLSPDVALVGVCDRLRALASRLGIVVPNNNVPSMEQIARLCQSLLAWPIKTELLNPKPSPSHSHIVSMLDKLLARARKGDWNDALGPSSCIQIHISTFPFPLFITIFISRTNRKPKKRWSSASCARRSSWQS